MAKDKRIIRAGDRVKILNPVFIHSWGYENNLQAVKEELLSKYTSQYSSIVDTLVDMALNRSARQHFAVNDSYQTRIKASKLSSIVAYEVVGARMKDGAERKLFYYTNRCDGKDTHRYVTFEQYGEVTEGWVPCVYPVEVKEVKMVQTGKYFSPGVGHYDYYNGDYDPGDPGGLDEPKHHKLLRITHNVWIEACNVEKIHE